MQLFAIFRALNGRSFLRTTCYFAEISKHYERSFLKTTSQKPKFIVLYEGVF